MLSQAENIKHIWRAFFVFRPYMVEHKKKQEINYLGSTSGLLAHGNNKSSKGMELFVSVHVHCPFPSSAMCMQKVNRLFFWQLSWVPDLFCG